MRRTAIAATAVFLGLSACAAAQSSLTPAQWQADLQYLASQLPSRHPNLFFQMSAQDFNSAVTDLNQRIPQLSGAQIVAGMMRIAAMAGDAHTSVTPAYPRLPIGLRWFSNGLFVISAAPEYRRALGTQVVQIGNMTDAQAYETVVPVISHENDQWVREQSATYLAVPEILGALGVAPAAASVRYVFQDLAGTRFSLDVAPSAATAIESPDSNTGYIPLWRQKQNQNYWYEYLPGSHQFYIAYNRCQNMPELSFQALVQQIATSPEADTAEGLILDLRNNAGGDSSVIQPLFDLLNQYGDLRGRATVLIGRRTFSSGLMGSVTLADQYGALLIGEATGGKPNHYGNPASFTLPNSGLWVSCSTRYYSTRPADSRTSLTPDVELSMSSADYFARHDPFLLAALEQPARYRAPQGGGALPATVSSASFGGPVSPGSLASVFGDFSGVQPASAPSIPIATTLAGVQVKVNGVAAPLLAVGPGQINFQVPGATAPGAAQIAIVAPGRALTSGAMQVVSSSPGIFLKDFLSLDRPGAVLRQDGQLTDATVRARRNEVIILFGTGAGELTAPVADGAAAPFAPLAETIRKPRVFVGSEEAVVEYSGLAPGFVGLWQINARVPDTASIAGQMPVVTIAPGGYASNAVTLWFE